MNNRIFSALKPAMVVAALCISMSTLAFASTQSSGNPITERVGPNASQSFPEFPDEAEFPRAEIQDVPLIAESGFANVTKVEIDDGNAVPARPQPGWQPANISGSDLKLEIGPEEAFDVAWVERQFYINGMISANVPLDQISSLVQIINRAFIANGYINSGLLIDGAPPENGGSLKLRLISGRIASGNPATSGIVVNWGLDGRNRLSEDYVINRMPAVKNIPLNAIEIEQQFRLLTENPAIQTVNAELRPGAKPGEAQLLLTVNPKPLLDIYFSAANSRSPSIGGERYSVGGSFRNALRPGDFLSVESGRTAGKYDFIAGYETPLLGPRTSLRVRGGFNDAAVIDPQLLALNIAASDWHIEGGVSHIIKQRPLSPRAKKGGWQSARTITLGLNVAHRQSTTKLFGRRFSFSPGAVDGRTEYTALRLNADLVQRGVNTVLALSITGTQGLEGTDANIPGLLRPDPNFRAIRGQVSYARRLNDKGLELRARLAGQWADGILYSGERFSAGGADTVRGYRETLVLSDTGAVGSVELVQSFNLLGKKAARSDFNAVAFSASTFIDGAILKNRAGARANPNEVGSIGASLAWTPSPAIRTQFTYARRLKKIAIPGTRDIQDRGFHFRLTIRPLEFFRR